MDRFPPTELVNRHEGSSRIVAERRSPLGRPCLIVVDAKSERISTACNRSRVLEIALILMLLHAFRDASVEYCLPIPVSPLW